MKKLIIPLLFIAFTINVNAQIKAVTESGDQVILYNDGSWKYLSGEPKVKPEITTNDKQFLKSNNATFLIKSKILNIGIWIDPKVWSFVKSENGPSEYKFELRGESLYGMIITEKLKMPVETLLNIAITNAREAAPDVQVTKQEYRTVNGHKVLMMQMSGTMQGIKFGYFGYYWSDENGSFQFLTYTVEDMMEQYSSNIEEFLNGITFL